MKNKDQIIEDQRQALEAARQVIKEQDDVLQMVTQMPQQMGVVLKVDNKKRKMLSSHGGSPVRVTFGKLKAPKVGDTYFTADTGQPLELSDWPCYGAIYTVDELLTESDELIVDMNGVERVVAMGQWKGYVNKGDQIVTDTSTSVVMKVMPPKKRHRVKQQVATVGWDDIGGLADAKRELIDAVLTPHRNADLYLAYGKTPPKGVLLYGPPGCGKTMLAKALAGEYGQNAMFNYIKGPEVLNEYVGVSERKIREAFEAAKRHKEETGFRSVLFFDEAEALMGSRGQRSVTSALSATIVPTFLSMMDGMEDSGALVLLATNRPDTLDSAITRDGRIDVKVKVGRPDRDTAESIFRIYLQKTRMAQGYTVTNVSKSAADFLFEDEHTMYYVRTKNGTHRFGLPDLLSGAMICGMVEKATMKAMRRDLDSKAKSPSGVTQQDVMDTVAHVFNEQRELNHEEDLKSFAIDIGEEIEEVARF